MAWVRALKRCFAGNPVTALREVGDEFEYAGPRAAYLELLSGEWTSTAARPQLDHDRDGKEGGSRAALQPAPEQPATVEPQAEPEPEPAPEPEPEKAEAKPRAERSPEEKAERSAAIAKLRAAGVKFFAGDTTENLKALAADL